MMDKKELIEAIFTSDELKNIVSTIPKELQNTIDSSKFVLDFNKQYPSGKIINIFEVAKKRGMNCIFCDGRMEFKKDYLHGDLDKEKDDVFICNKCDSIISADGTFFEFPVRVIDYSGAKTWNL